ncbi:MAG TPA: NADH:ubiquinone oxidoreductase subunit NDUFA12 [Azospirillaceae bacterium]|nr:NADH:ubiquinone oxidoreductase subunit NDUFA12 [Azospirillaceae bacterium]
MSDRISFVTWMASLHIRFTVWRLAEKVGTDRMGNTYFQEKKARPGMKTRRWVIFRGEPEATKVPPEWHGWLHYTHDKPITDDSPFRKPWLKDHQPNLTGTAGAYRPPGHQYEGGQRSRATGDYEPWTPS